MIPVSAPRAALGMTVTVEMLDEPLEVEQLPRVVLDAGQQHERDFGPFSLSFDRRRVRRSSRVGARDTKRSSARITASTMCSA